MKISTLFQRPQPENLAHPALPSDVGYIAENVSGPPQNLEADIGYGPRQSANVVNDDSIAWYHGPPAIAAEYNFKPIGIPDALRSELTLSAQILLAKSAQEPEYATVMDDGTPMIESRGYSMFQALMDQPNDTSNFLDLISRTLASVATMGKIYWLRGQRNGMATTSLWPVSREHMVVQYGDTGVPEAYHVISSSFSPTQRRMLADLAGAGPYKPEQVIEFNLLKSELGAHREHHDTSDAIYPLDALLGVLTIDSKMTARTSSLMSLGAGTVVSPDNKGDGTTPMGQDQENVSLDFVQSRMKELTQMAADGSPVVFPIPVKVEQIGFPPNQMFPRGMSNRPEGRVAAVCGIPLGLMGYELSTEGGQSYASLAVQRQFFAETTQLPLLKYICHVITREVLHEFVPYGKFMVLEDTIRALQEDENDKIERAVKAFTSSILTLNQVLDYLGYETIGENGEIRFIPANAALIKTDGTLFGQAQALPVTPGPNSNGNGNAAAEQAVKDLIQALN